MQLISASSLAALALASVSAAALDPTVSQACTVETFRNALPAGASVEAVDRVEAGGQYGEGARNLGYPGIATELPELCAVIIKVVSSPISSYRFGMFLPTTWNSRFLTVGNGGFGGGINWLDVAVGARYGFATVSTDTGHNSSLGDVSWATNEETRQDWGHRSIHGAATLGKDLVEAFYSRQGPVKHSYYSGCSTGGRQGIKEAQLYPDTFDAILVGAPAWWTSHLQPWTLWIGAQNLPADAPNHIPLPLFPTIAAEVMKQCDDADGVADGIISEPDKCSLDMTTLLCPDSAEAAVDASDCLTAAQIETVDRLHGDYVADGRFAFPGLSISSEGGWVIPVGGPAPLSYGTDYVKYMLLNDPTWKWQDYSDGLLWLAAAVDPGNASATEYDMSPFRARGGKVILYHGIADPLITSKSSRYLHQQVANATSGDVVSAQDWLRYFDVPGMGHCSGTSVEAPWYIGGANQAPTLGGGAFSVPGFSDAEHDALLALMKWAEEGEAPGSIIATTWNNQTDPASGVLRQRPLCPYPQVARHDGEGDVNAAASWTCA